MTLTDPETRLVCALLHEYRLNLLRQMRDPSKQLTDAGREAYWRDIATAESAAEKLEPRTSRPTAQAIHRFERRYSETLDRMAQE